jgi:hypothetical protein
MTLGTYENECNDITRNTVIPLLNRAQAYRSYLVSFVKFGMEL